MKIRKIALIILALIAVWFGLRIIGLKFYRSSTGSMENTIPAGTRLTVWKMNFAPSRSEIIIYRNPERDTVTIPYSPTSYYSMIRSMDRKTFDSKFQKSFVPLNKRERWIGRCVGLPGDELEILDSKLMVNGELYRTAGELLPSVITEKNTFDPLIFPYSPGYSWNKDNFGKITIPKKGVGIKLDTGNLPVYKRLITVYEKNNLSVTNGEIMINGNKTDTYIPKMDYYFIICDNRDNSYDSRYWGFLPENHIYGKVLKMYE